jgi:hypothetical protein
MCYKHVFFLNLLESEFYVPMWFLNGRFNRAIHNLPAVGDCLITWLNAIKLLQLKRTPRNGILLQKSIVAHLCEISGSHGGE